MFTMICTTSDQLSVNPNPVQSHSAPESRRGSLVVEYGNPQRKEEGAELSLTLCPLTTSLPDCSETVQVSTPNPRSSARSGLSPRASKYSKQEARQAFKDRSSSSPCPPSPCPSSSLDPKRPRSLLRHHTSLDSAALACEFFGHRSSVSKLSDPSRERDNFLPSQHSLREEESMTSSPLLRRPLAMFSSALSGAAGPLLRRPTVTSASILQAHAGVIPPSSSTPLRRRLTITLPSSLPVSPVAVRTQKTTAAECRTPSLESCSSGEPSSPSSYFRVVVLGDVGVGKTTLIRQMTSFKGASCGVPDEGPDHVAEEANWVTQRIVVSLDRNDERCALEIFDNPLDANIDHLRPDAFIVIYSVSNRKSYLTAKEVTRHLRCELGMDRPVFLVGNKTDLRRQQRVTSREAKDVAEAYDCCVVETSAALRINVDTLLPQVLDRILEQLEPPRASESHRSLGNHRSDVKARGTSPGRAVRFFSKILRRAFLRRSISSEAVGVC